MKVNAAWNTVKARVQKITILTTMLVIGVISSVTTSSAVIAHGVVDQSQLIGPHNQGGFSSTGWRQLLAFQPHGQEFTPSKPILLGVDVGIDADGQSPNPGDDTIRVNIRKGSISNPVLATAAQLVPEDTPRGSLTHFDLPSPLVVTPGDTYVLELQATNTTHGWNGETTPSMDAYPGGAAIINGVVSPTEDYVFQTYADGFKATCFGEPATIVGTEGNDVLQGTPGDDVIVGLGGNDVIFGRDENDLICGGDGNDTIFGDLVPFFDVGNDRIHGGDGDDRIFGGPRDDEIDGGNGDGDICDGGPGMDTATNCETLRNIP